MAIFNRTCLLSTTGGKLLALVLPSIGNGPLNVVLDGQPGCFSCLDVGVPAWVGQERIQARGLDVELEMAHLWDPRPDWDKMRTRLGRILTQIPLLQRLGRRHADQASLLELLSGSSSSPEATNPTLPDAVAHTALEGAQALRKGVEGDTVALRAGAARLAGLGVGLTPAGDDFLCGLMMWAWLVHPDPQSLCWILLEAASETTTLSAAFLQAAARGECSEDWHRLLITLADGTEEQIDLAVQKVLALGSTSGADTLAGFLYVAGQPDP